ncbi:leptin receptor gene-related protein [Ctenocephalides felis]|uniref:leptin receptor gene-related protein n=1 Tax=Ctenocephalides felis TaxID=7515 RepID=UPI000E6E1B12|nr:leptin receptor gene-related protein [Ctenocephalides felis]
MGMTLVILACALPHFNKLWWPFFVVIFYILAPLPTMIAKRYSNDSSSSNACLEFAIFITMGIVVSSFALPIVLARTPAAVPTPDQPGIQWAACYLTLAGNVVVYLTLLGFFLTFDQDDADYSMW